MFLQKKLFFVLRVAHSSPFLLQVGFKNTNFSGFIYFSELLQQPKLLILTESPNIFHQKSAKNTKLRVGSPSKVVCTLIICTVYRVHTCTVPLKIYDAQVRYQTNDSCILLITLGVQTFTSRKLRKFREFCSYVRKLILYS